MNVSAVAMSALLAGSTMLGDGNDPSTLNILSAEENTSSTTCILAIGGGVITGALGGAGIGTVVPGIGTGIGGIVGAFSGGMLGASGNC